MDTKSLDDLLTELVGIVNRTRPGQVTHKIADIKEHVREEQKESR